jgi:required for meiotic nuclear division protein 1
MNAWNFQAIVAGNEINLSAIASHFGINKKFKWEDPLILSGNALNGLLKNTEDKHVYIYYFGSIVFINMEFHEIQDVVKYLKTIDKNLKIDNIQKYTDDYRLEVNPEYEYSLGNDAMTASVFEEYYLDIISMILAKSISLEKVEDETDKLLDNIEDVIGFLEQGTLNMSDKELAKTTAKVIRFKYNTISNLMLFEKPSAAWNNEDIEKFFMEMMGLFDLEDRYTKITRKTEILRNITEVFGSLSHEKRATKLEVIVIVLILFEVIIAMIEFFLPLYR